MPSTKPPKTKSLSPAQPQNDNAAGVCPICDAACQAEYKPFCSRRCADVDLHRWLEGSYAVPAVEDEASAFDGEEN